MRFSPCFSKAIAVITAPALFVCISVQTVNAAMIATEDVAKSTAAADARARLHEFLDRQDVHNVLEAWGVNAEEAKRRVNSLTDVEVAGIAGRLDQMPAGSSTVGIIVGAILLVFFVLLITDLLGLTDVFPFIKSQRR